jgi:hypothetical protein
LVGDRYYATSPMDDPTGPSEGSYWVLRGGGWYLGASYCRASYRDGGDPGLRFGPLGIRLARIVSLPDSGKVSPRKVGDKTPQSKDRPTPKPSAPPAIPPAAKPSPAASEP